ncbi:MAG: transcription antitermination factor NusB [Kiritimatiellia bacterium]|nr:transcription antitermination factor NusB [Kiritimatiellia bacterium]MDP6631829.1 transcription antitermination factor NusB [Kiritimatiellia bacterium]MDP6811533.1 transcription antitermination factor NusB [Kiritimatiellia bacterium]MDP6971971.1 transcription antitermination factor NusB [Pseudomonadales bacterium]
MGSTRRDAREWAVQLLFQMDLNNPKDMRPVFAHFWEDVDADDKARDYAERMVRGVMSRRGELDETIDTAVEHWDVKRLAVIDRNVIRLAVYEMLHCTDVPPVVSINEAVDIVKYFGTAESGGFVNGVLDRIRKGLDRPSRTAD